MNQSKNPTPVAVAGAVIVLAILVWAVYYANNMSAGSSSAARSQSSSATAPAMTQAESAALVSKVSSEAVQASTIDISACSPKPATANIKMGTLVHFVNNDPSNHTISFSPDHTFVVPKNGNKAIRFDFWTFPGVRRYSCDDTQAVGTVYISAAN